MTLNPTVIVRRAERRDEEAILAFIKKAYGPLGPYKDVERWRWQFLSNPAAAGDHTPSIWIALDGIDIVGQIAAQRTEIALGERRLSGGWIVDVMVLPAYRGQGLGQRIYAAAAESGMPLLTLTMAPATRRMAEKLGAANLPPVALWMRPASLTGADLRAYVAHRLRNRPKWRAAAELVGALGLFSPLARTWAAGTRLGARRIMQDAAVTLHAVRRFGPEIECVWRSIPPRFGLVPRTFRHLNWRYADAPQLAYECFVARRSGETVGLLVLRRADRVELRHGIIVEAMALDDHACVWRSLFGFAVSHLDDVAFIEAAASTAVPEHILRSLAFVRVRRLAPTLVCQDGDVRRQFAAQPAWFFNKGDHDWDQVVPADDTPRRSSAAVHPTS